MNAKKNFMKSKWSFFFLNHKATFPNESYQRQRVIRTDK